MHEITSGARINAFVLVDKIFGDVISIIRRRLLSDLLIARANIGRRTAEIFPKQGLVSVRFVHMLLILDEEVEYFLREDGLMQFNCVAVLRLGDWLVGDYFVKVLRKLCILRVAILLLHFLVNARVGHRFLLRLLEGLQVFFRENDVQVIYCVLWLITKHITYPLRHVSCLFFLGYFSLLRKDFNIFYFDLLALV